MIPTLLKDETLTPAHWIEWSSDDAITKAGWTLELTPKLISAYHDCPSSNANSETEAERDGVEVSGENSKKYGYAELAPKVFDGCKGKSFYISYF